MATVVRSMATSGVEGFMVEIEASTIRGQQQMISIIGLPDQAIKEQNLVTGTVKETLQYYENITHGSLRTKL